MESELSVTATILKVDIRFEDQRNRSMQIIMILRINTRFASVNLVLHSEAPLLTLINCAILLLLGILGQY